MPVLHPSSASTRSRKPQRKLKPEVVAQLVARRSESQLEKLYEKPVSELSPDELALMRAAFFRG